MVIISGGNNFKHGYALNRDLRSAKEGYMKLIRTLDLVHNTFTQFKALSNDENKAKRRNSKKGVLIKRYLL